MGEGLLIRGAASAMSPCKLRELKRRTLRPAALRLPHPDQAVSSSSCHSKKFISMNTKAISQR
jgi:hypothetical protein